jgi:hypothetical protein
MSRPATSARAYRDQRDRTTRQQRTRLAPQERLIQGWHEQQRHRESIEWKEIFTRPSANGSTERRVQKK